jgi:predicted Zn-dependent peptidase
MKNTKILLLLLAFCAAQGLWGQAEDFRKQAPQPGPAPRIEMGKYETFILGNGLQVIVVENSKLPRVSFQLLVDAPPIREAQFTGAASLAGDMLSRGTATRSKAEIDQAIDFIGARFSTSQSGMFGSCLSRHRDQLLEIMADALLNPAFPEEEFEKVKQQRLSALAFQKDDANAIAGNVGQVLRYGKDHPYGEIATERTIDNVTLERCRSFYDNYFKPEISYLAIVGDIKLEEAKAAAEKYFGTWERGDVGAGFFKRPEAPAQLQVNFVDRPGAVQSVVRITYPLNLKPGSDDAILANLVNTILGDGGLLGSRLNSNIREDKGYSYGVNSTLATDKYVGYFSAGGSVRNEVTDSAVTEFLYEMSRLREEPVAEQELAGIKNFIFGKFARGLEQPQTVATFALNTIRYKLPEDFYATYLEKTAALTADDVQKGAQRFLLPERAHILVVGNKEQVADKLARFAPDGKVHYFDNEGNPIQAPSPELTASVDPREVIEKYIQAIGGREKLEAVQDLTINMATSFQGMEINMSMQRKVPNKLLMNVSMGGMVMNSTRFDGERGVVSAMGQQQEMEPEQLKSAKQQAAMFPELLYLQEGYELSLAGIEKVDGSDAYRIDITHASGNKSSEYFDVESGLKVRTIAIQQGPDGGEVSIVNEFAKYQEVQGILIPHQMKVSGMGPMPLTMKVESAELNQGLEDSLFEVE